VSQATNGKRGVGATLLVLGTFVLGMIAGAALLHIASRSMRTPPFLGGALRHRPPIEHIRRDLDLTPEQAEKLRAILDETHGRMRAEADATRESIRQLLTPEQRERFDSMHPGPLGPPGSRPRHRR